MQVIIGNIIIGAGIVFMAFGLMGICRFNDFYTRLLVASKSDTVGALTFMVGMAIRYGPSFFSGKILILAVIMLIFNPLVAHMLARSAYISEQNKEDEEG